MTISKIAKKFGMTVGELATCMGYSRQALYSPECFSNIPRAQASIAALRNLNAVMYKQERTTALRQFKARERAVKELENIILRGGDS